MCTEVEETGRKGEKKGGRREGVSKGRPIRHTVFFPNVHVLIST